MTLENLLGRYEGATQLGDGSWMVCCPVPGHGRGDGDQNPSLHVTVNEDGTPLFKCFAGCSQEDVLRHSGFAGGVPRVTGLEEGFTPAARATPAVPLTEAEADQRHRANYAVLEGLTLKEAHREHLLGRGLTAEDIGAAEYQSLPYGILIPYRDPYGRILGMQVRHFEGDPKYTWHQRGTPAKSTPHVPLACSDLKDDVVRVTEGGLKADVVAALERAAGTGRVYTVGVAGADNWEAALSVLEVWNTRTVRLAFDPDKAGRNAAAEMAAHLRDDGYQVELEIWDGAAHKGLDDLLAAGQAPEVLTGEEVWEWVAENRPRKAAGKGTVLVFPPLVPLGDYLKAPDARADWLWHGYLNRGEMTILAGPPKVGKSTLMVAMLGASARGETLFGGRTLKPHFKAAVITQEARVHWQERAAEQGLTSEHLLFQEGPDRRAHPGKRLSPFAWEALAEHLAREVKRLGIDLVIIDTLADFWPVQDENAAGQITDALKPLELITEAGACILGNHHTRKGGGKHGEDIRGSGQLAGEFPILLVLRRGTGPNRDLMADSRHTCTPKKLSLRWDTDGRRMNVVKGAEGVKGAVRQQDQQAGPECATEKDEPGARLRKYLEENGKVSSTKARTSLRMSGRVFKAAKESLGDALATGPKAHLSLKGVGQNGKAASPLPQ